MRVVAFGDSFTFGHGLPDVDEEALGYLPTTPSKDAWPQLLANLMQTECANFSECGASNKEIWLTITEAQLSKNDIVTVMWSTPERTCVVQEPLHGDVKNNKLLPVGTWLAEEGDPTSVAYYKYLYTDADALYTTLLYINHINLYLKPRVKHVKHLWSPHMPHSVDESVDALSVQWNLTRPEFTCDFLRASKLKDGHMGKEGNYGVAKMLFSQYKKLFLT